MLLSRIPQELYASEDVLRAPREVQLARLKKTKWLKVVCSHQSVIRSFQGRIQAICSVDCETGRMATNECLLYRTLRNFSQNKTSGFRAASTFLRYMRESDSSLDPSK